MAGYELISVGREITNILAKAGVNIPVEEDLYDSMDHGELVRLLITLLCNQMDIHGEDRLVMMVAAGVHDIGKLSIGNNIYGRDKKALHVEEVKYMRMHTEIGKKLLEQCGYPERIVNAVYHHHENYDGSGYPDNLSGDQIPFESRMLRVCDGFAALISDRPYRKAFDMDTAISMMIDDIKTYDMQIFLEFMKLFNSDEFAKAMELSMSINEKHRYVEKKESNGESVFI